MVNQKISGKPVAGTTDELYKGSVLYVEPSKLVPFERKFDEKRDDEKNIGVRNPFKVPEVADDKEMQELRRGIEEYGILVPLTVRKIGEEKYELLSGYRRKKAVEDINRDRERKGLTPLTLPIAEVQCGNEQAIEILATSNTYRKNITLIEKIRACGFAYRAMRRKGRYADSEEEKRRAADVVGEMFGLEPKQVQRYSRFLNLNDELLKLVCKEDVIFEEDGHPHLCRYKTEDKKIKLSRRAGEILSVLSKSQQEIIFQFLRDSMASIPVSKATFVRRMFKENPELTLQDLQNIAKGWKGESETISGNENKVESDSKSDPESLESKNYDFRVEELQSLFPEEMLQEERRRLVHTLLYEWREAGSPENFEIKSTEQTQAVVEGCSEV